MNEPSNNVLQFWCSTCDRIVEGYYDFYNQGICEHCGDFTESLDDED